MTERQLKYDWRRTWPDKPHDFVCVADGQIIGRVQLHDTGPMKHWMWSMSTDGFEIEPQDGFADDKMEVCRLLEKAYIEAIAKGE